MKNNQPKVLPREGNRRSKIVLMTSSIVYAIWLLWLAYVAWVNVTAGNQ